MLVIRLRRTGTKHKPTYRIVVVDQRKSVYAPYVKMLGTYDPKNKKTVLNKDEALEWMKKGAMPSNTVSKILQKEGIKHNSIKIKKYKAISKKELEAQKAAEEAEKAKEAAEKEAAKAAFEEKVEAEKAAAPKEDKLQEMAEESIAEVKEEETAKEAEKKEEVKEEPGKEAEPEETKEKPEEPTTK